MKNWMKNLVVLFVLALGFGIGASDVRAVPIGAGADAYDQNDVLDNNSGGIRLNIDRVNSVDLGAGTYQVTSAAFNFERASQNADDIVIPFLAVETGTDTYETLWVGGTITPGVAGIETTNYGFGTEQFTLDAATDVLAGFWQGDNVVLFNTDNQDATLTAHDNSPVLPDPLQTPQVLEDFSHPDLNNRTYLFEINVAPVPEPSTLLLLGSGIAGLGLWRLRRNSVGS